MAELAVEVATTERGIVAIRESEAGSGDAVAKRAQDAGLADARLADEHDRLPHDFAEAVARIQNADDVMLIVCAGQGDVASPLLVRPAPVRLPSLAGRQGELSRIIEEYGRDAIADLGAALPGFSDADRAWVREHAVTSLTAIEKATLRLVAIRASRNVSAAAGRDRHRSRRRGGRGTLNKQVRETSARAMALGCADTGLG